MADLLAAHAAMHAWFEDRIYAAIEQLVSLNVSEARATFEQMARVLDEHMAFEEALVLPAYRDVAPKDGPGRADHVDGDHTIIKRSVAAIREMFDELRADDLRAVLERLPVIYRLLSTLEHHTAREQQNVYPALERTLPPEKLQEIAGELRKQKHEQVG